MSVCRPKVLTTRWIEEFTQAIHMVCPDAKAIKCTPDRTLEETWSAYEQHLAQSQCLKHPTVQRIVNYEEDYNDILTPSQR